MGYYVGLDVSLKRTAICVLDADGRVVWRGSSDTHPGMIGEALDRWRGSLERVGLETGSTTPWLARGLKALGLPVVVMDARRAADALKARVMKTDVADARALAEMLRTGWYTEVFVKSEDSHRIKALLSARDQLVRNKRTFFGLGSPGANSHAALRNMLAADVGSRGGPGYGAGLCGGDRGSRAVPTHT